MESEQTVSFSSIRHFLYREKESAQFWIIEWIALGLASIIAIQTVVQLICRSHSIFTLCCMASIGLYTGALSVFELERYKYSKKLLHKMVEETGNERG